MWSQLDSKFKLIYSLLYTVESTVTPQLLNRFSRFIFSCVARSQHNPSDIRVTLGDYILNSDIESLPHEVFSVADVKLHPNFRFTPQADRYDVAILILDRNVQYRNNIKPICLPPKDASFLGRVAYVAGWGALSAGKIANLEIRSLPCYWPTCSFNLLLFFASRLQTKTQSAAARQCTGD